MRRPGGGHYGGADAGGGHYVGANSGAADATYNSGHPSMQQQQIKSEQQQQQQQQWRWERESPNLPTNSMSPNMFPEGKFFCPNLQFFVLFNAFPIGQGSETSRPYYQSQRDPRLALENQGGKDPRAQPREEDMDIGYEDKPVQQTFEGLEQKFLDDIMKLTKEQNDAEDAENSRHREVCSAYLSAPIT
ncbi:putative FAD-linked sulfhydryl oxidase ERV1-like [Capsicum annuum]|nr:putative FAD-linked sulfhydryl oxidase ERV1-like [Capsicum annuum]